MVCEKFLNVLPDARTAMAWGVSDAVIVTGVFGARSMQLAANATSTVHITKHLKSFFIYKSGGKPPTREVKKTLAVFAPLGATCL